MPAFTASPDTATLSSAPLPRDGQPLLVTIAIPTYNRAGSYLPGALRSALAQTYPALDILVSDNCSTDDTEAVVRGFKDDRIRYVRHPQNIGASNNFNFCVEQARGAFFLLLHDDDLIDPDLVATCIAAAPAGGDVGIIRTGTRVIDAQGRTVHEKRNVTTEGGARGFFESWFENKTWYLCSTLFHTARLREIGGFRSRHSLFEDVMAEVTLAARFGSVDIAAIKASFRVHPDEQTNAAKVSSWCEDSLLLLDLLTEVAGPDREQTRREGMRLFAAFNYNRALGVRSLRARLGAYVTVLRMFGFRHWPSRFHLLHLTAALVSRTPLYPVLRSVKRQVVDVGGMK
jgi:glycosyltransferase involved in cell wall biosynthesis